MKWKKYRPPTKTDLTKAHGRSVPDVIARDLDVLFCGINPSLYSAATGYHFARPGNRFWPTLAVSGYTPRVLAPQESDLLLDLGYGISNIVNRATARADELTELELMAGGQALITKVRHFRPRFVAILGIGAYRAAFGIENAALGLQTMTLGGANLWLLPNPSGLNANYQLADLAKLFRTLRRAVDRR